MEACKVFLCLRIETNLKDIYTPDRQMTVQELSSLIRSGVKPIIFVINNKGYTTERLLHPGEER
jgi:hypothetical protein